MTHQTLLIELGCEELPASEQKSIAHQLADRIEEGLTAKHIDFGRCEIFSSPRRLAVLIHNVATTQPGRTEERFGPNSAQAFSTDGTPTLACIGFAKSAGVSVDQLFTKETPKGKKVCCIIEHTGNSTITVLPDILVQVIHKLTLNKTMRWGHTQQAFIRPVRWLVALLGRDIIPVELFGCHSDRNTRGHRFLCNKPLKLNTADDYVKTLLKKGFVIPCHTTRQNTISEQIVRCLPPDSEAINNQQLLEEVTSLVEWPTAQVGHFNPRFLDLPDDVLVTSITTHLKTFPIFDSNKKLTPTFVIISNALDVPESQVIKGNEKVIHARLSDAEFFYKNDISHGIDSWGEKLHSVLFQKGLGSIADKVSRISALSLTVADQLDGPINRNTLEKACPRIKNDLVSEMVVEFPELQGVMGAHYAEISGLGEAAATCIREHYLPRFSGDVLPSSTEACIIAIADRLDTIAGIFSIGKEPTGEKDPFSLRRYALGVIRIIVEKNIDLDLSEVLRHAIEPFHLKVDSDTLYQRSLAFIFARLKAWYTEKEVPVGVLDAVFSQTSTQLCDIDQRIMAVRHFQTLPQASDFAALNKRVSNLLKKSSDGKNHPFAFCKKMLKQTEEITLAQHIERCQKESNLLLKDKKYTEQLSLLTGLKPDIDAFFDCVTIMDKNEQVRQNRIALLQHLQGLLVTVADISLL